MLDPKHPLAELLRRDSRYQFEAYVFVFDALRYGQDRMGLGQCTSGEFEAEGKLSADDFEDAELDDADPDSLDALLRGADEEDHHADDSEAEDDEAERHVTGQELCWAIRQYALDQYGLLARNVLAHWGVTKTGDFGEIVFNLIDIGQMRKTDQDRREDFDEVFDFANAFAEQGVFTLGLTDGEDDE